MKKVIRVVLLLVLLGAAGAWLWRSQTKDRQASGPLRFYGNVDIREVNLGFRVAGRITQVLRDEGDAVNAGQELARLDDNPFKRELEESEARLASARARLQLLKNGIRPQEIAQAKAVLTEREVAASNAERLFKRQQELFQNRTVSVQERDDAEARWREAEARTHSAREQLALLEAGFREEEIAQASAEVSRAEAAVATSRVRLEDTILKAPSDGVVITRAQEPGAIVQNGATVLTLLLERPVWIRAYVSEPDLGRIQPGIKVKIYTDTNPDKPYTGQIGFISPKAEFTPKNVETPELRTSLVYRVRITVESPDGRLRQGMPVTLRLERE